MTNDSHQKSNGRLPSSSRGLLILAGLVLFLFLAYAIYMTFFFSFGGPPRVQEIALADLNGNGYVDAYLAIGPSGEPYMHPDYVLFNQGDGRFIDSGQSVGSWDSSSVKLGDINGDGLVDAVVGAMQVYIHLNYGQELFNRGHYSPGLASGGTWRVGVALGDLNGDGSLDIFAAACCGGGNIPPEEFFSVDMVWLNRGDGRFNPNSQPLATSGSNDVALGDLNRDGFLDAFVAGGLSANAETSTAIETPNTVWLNDGHGAFHDSGQRLGQVESMAVALGDLNGNGFLDAVVGNRGQDEIWLNDGHGNFTLDEQRLGSEPTRFVFTADLNGDGYLDIFTGEETGGQAWFNDGAGNFTAGDQRITYDRYDGVTLGDVTGDGRIDVFVAGVDSYQVWRNDGRGLFTAGLRARYR